MRKTLIIVSFCIVALLGAYASYRGYKVWNNKHLIGLSHEFLAKSDTRNAVLSAQEVLRSDPNNLEATRVMAQITDAAHSPSALLWRSRVVELNPNSLEDRLAFVQTALTMRDYASATNGLEGVDAAERKAAAYHNMAGAVDAVINHLNEAEKEFLEASRLEPQNPGPQLSLAVVRLHGSNEVERARARVVLQGIARNPTNGIERCQALRELTADALVQRDVSAAVTFSKQLMQETNSTFADRIQRLQAMLENTNAEFKSALAETRAEAASDPGRIFELARWEMGRTPVAETLAWLRALPVKTQTNQPTTLLIADAYMASQDWRDLNTWISKQHWGELEFLRHALMSHDLREQGLEDTAKTEWDQALNAATGQKRSLIMLLGLSSNPDNVALNGQKQSFVMLLRLAVQWGWVNEQQDLLWTIANRYPEEKWATQALARTLFAGGQTRSLMRLFNEEFKRTPSDLTAKNNLAMIALLLGAKEFKPNDLARDVYEKAPTNAYYVSTYAFSLYTQGKSAEALELMRKLRPNELESPVRAGYYGLLLKATGSGNEAKTYLDAASKIGLLPEERTLFDRARNGT